ncbi:MAG: ATP-dependent DNA helicase RecG, partial [Clostridia bacterium]|nr:ATP-dependent DNA helicase RecG [Clostridia bacterium]
ALIENNVEFASLSLVITDEQHRFGVKQREKLENKISLEDEFDKESKPHMLVMSATPIPRTLAMMLYGDLDITIVSDMPPGRQKVDTFAVGEEYRERLNKFIEKHIGNGNQVYVVCPLVKDPEEQDNAISEKNALKSVENFCKELENRFPNYRIGLMHGKLKTNDKDKVMEEFSKGNINILVSTTVIEVGVNVPNATLMIIENSERFGLSQLHQLRGRVGRGDTKSYCVLVSPALNGNRKQANTSPTVSRLNVLCSTNNGFEIAEHDLALRGPGEFFGERQHGELRFKIADLVADMELVEKTRELAKKLLSVQ